MLKGYMTEFDTSGMYDTESVYLLKRRRVELIVLPSQALPDLASHSNLKAAFNGHRLG